jgi:hypothetical protein
MAVEQPNRGQFLYVDANGDDYNKKGEVEGVRQAVDGSAAPTSVRGWGRDTPKRHVRKIIYQDATTFRTKTVIFYTAAAWEAITLGSSTLTFMIEGSATGVVYTARKKIAENLGVGLLGGHLIEHA